MQPSSRPNERDIISPTPLMGSNKLGMASGWSSTFETQAAIDPDDGNANETDHVGALPGPREPFTQVTHPKLQNVPSFGTLLKDYTVQGPNRFEAPVYAEGAVPSPPVAQQVEIDVNLILRYPGTISKQPSLVTLSCFLPRERLKFVSVAMPAITCQWHIYSTLLWRQWNSVR